MIWGLKCADRWGSAWKFSSSRDFSCLSCHILRDSTGLLSPAVVSQAYGADMKTPWARKSSRVL